MGLYEQIFLRKSCRSYQMEPLPATQLQEIEAFVSGMRPLLPGVSIGHRAMGPGQIKGLLAPKAPHYFVLTGRPQPYRDLCAGFLFQQLDLYLSGQGLGSCWLGAARGRGTPFGADDILAISFGRPAVAPTRTVEAFKRKPLSAIATGEDPRLEAARLAPSGMNAQPWYFIAQEGVIHVYQAVPRGPMAKLYRFQELDVGIALCHLALASEAHGLSFQFEPKQENAPQAPHGFTYVGTVM